MPQTPSESIEQEMERHQSELIGLREVINHLAVPRTILVASVVCPIGSSGSSMT
jgi:hypothetical protein